ncbi:MAG: polysaccharide deacetylase [Rhizobium sp.]|nr:polysaccharide deacetylase [Rhizobium sp.]
MLSQLKTIAKPLIKRAIISSGLEAAALMSSMGVGKAARGRGAIFTLHHVRPRASNAFQPNDILDITPEFLETAILALKREGYQFIRIEDIASRLSSPETTPFACFTLDDGYRDNAEFAASIFTKYGVPFTIFLTKGFVDATHSMWWETIDMVLNQIDRLQFDFGNGPETVAAATNPQKLIAFNRIADFINNADETQAVGRLDDAASKAGIDPLGITRTLTMRGDALRTLAENPLVTYGAHTVSHRGLARLSAQEAEREIAESVNRVTEIVGVEPKSFAYPYGDQRSVSQRERGMLRSLGIDIAVTTRPGTLGPQHASDLTATPRISLNGHYQKARYVGALASGLPFKLMG